VNLTLSHALTSSSIQTMLGSVFFLTVLLRSWAVMNTVAYLGGWKKGHLSPGAAFWGHQNGVGILRNNNEMSTDANNHE